MESRKRKNNFEISDRQRRRRVVQIVQQWGQQSEPTTDVSIETNINVPTEDTNELIELKNTSTDLLFTQNFIPDSFRPQNIEINSNDLPNISSSDESYISVQPTDKFLSTDTYSSSNENIDINRDVTSVEVTMINEALINNFQSMDYVKAKLGEWAVTERISHNSLKKLLAILKLVPSLSTVLPHDPRTLLQTAKQTNIREVFPGEYHHFGLAASIRDLQ